MPGDALAEFVAATASQFGIPGFAAGVWADGREIYGCHGVTSVSNPLPVDQDTVFHQASITKTYTATTLMRLAGEGRVELAAPVRRYVPELRLADEKAAAEITVLNLLNHTAGLGWRLVAGTGEGDDALGRYVAKMTELELIAAPGTRASYSQAGYNLAGRIIEKVTGLSYERAVASLVLEPLELTMTFYSIADIMTRRFAVGHNRAEDGTLAIARQWKDTRGDNPGGGIASTVSDQLHWARFHLGSAERGADVLTAGLRHQMTEPTVELRASTLGDAIGICWFLRDVAGVRTIGHGGSGNGQFAELLLVPDRNFAVTVMSNAGPDGVSANQAVVRWVLENYLGILDRDPEPAPYDHARAQEVAGTYETDALMLIVAATGERLTLEALIKPEIRAASDKELPADYPPLEFGFLPGDTDEYIVTSGGLKGQRGFFTRDAVGAVIGIDLAGRLATRSA